MKHPVRGRSGRTEYLQVRLDGELKNQVIDLCEKEECSLNAWLVEVIKDALRVKKGLPKPPRGVAPLPTPALALRAWMSGERLLAPCGKTSPCEGMKVEPEIHDGLQFCSVCRIRQL